MSSEKTPEQLEAQNEWLTNVNAKLVVMIRNAADVLGQYVQSLDQILVALRETQGIYSRLHSDLVEALNEQRGHGTGLREPHLRDATERRRESDLSDSSSDPNPFGPGDDSTKSA